MSDAPSPTGLRERMFARGGDMGARIATANWAGSPLGLIERWPAALVNAVAMMLPARAEIVLFWGPDYVALYNDAYAPTIGAKHPHALGRPAREGWAELWDDLEPLLAQVRATGETYAARDRPFHIERAGYLEEVFFDISYSAVPLDDGSVGGVLCIVSETTARVRAARELARDRQRLHEMFDAAPSFMAVLRVPGYVFEMANASYRQLAGRDDLIGRPLLEALPELAEQGIVETLDSVLLTGHPYRGIDVPVVFNRARRGRAEERRLDFFYQPLRDTQGAITGIFVEGIDLTERHRTEQALTVSRNALELATESAGIGTWDLDLLTGTLAWSSRTKAMFGFPSERQCTLDDFWSAVHPDDHVLVGKAFEAALDPARRADYDIEYRVVRPDDGEVRWIAAKGRAIFDGATCVRAIGTTVDITRQRTEGDRLRESEARFRALADSLPALVWMTDAKGAVVFANAGFETILGIDPQRFVAAGWGSLLYPEDRERIRAASTERMARPQVFGGDMRLRRPDGRDCWIHGEVRPRIVAGVFTGYIACAIDVTEAHLAGEQLEARIAERTAELTRQIAERERVEETLHQMQRLEAVGQLTSGVAHDFNNLLTVVLGNVDMLGHAARRGPLDERGLRRLEHVRTAAERGATLTAQLLAFSRRQRLEARVVDLNETVAGLSDLLASTLGRSIAIEPELGEGLWPALVDPTQIELIILNLAINARDAMPGGGRLRVATRNVSRVAPERPEEPPAGDYVCVAVADTGTGMADDVLARAFEPFFTTKEVGKGSGLGLAQVYGFAKQSGGGVRIDTMVGQGTTVRVFLPRADGDVETAPAPSTDAPSAASIKGRVVLVLDDEDAVREITAETLREAGCTVVEAADGPAALATLARDRSIEAVVADVAMPRMNGMEFAARATQARPGLPILFVTGYADLDAIDAVPEERIIRKPYPRAALVERVRWLLGS
jgi:PAS domain S-box-containing protein